MNTKRLILPIAGLLLLGGCATTQSTEMNERGAAHYDEEYVGVINQLAHKSGTRVIWVNPPRARKPQDGGE